MTAGRVGLLMAACTSPAGAPGDTATEDLRTGAFVDGDVAVSAVQACERPAAEASWTDVSATWGYDYELLPGPSLAQNPGALALFGVPGAWRIAWAGADATYAANLDGSAKETWLEGTPTALVVRDMDSDGTDDLMYLGSVVGVSWSGAAPGVADPRPPSRLTRARPPAIPSDMAFGDLDEDGDDDVVVAFNAMDHASMEPMRAAVLRNDGGGSYTEIPVAGDTSLWGIGFDMSVRDVDGDGHLDAYLCNDRGREFAPNVLFKGDGRLGLTPVVGNGLDLALSCMGSSWADADADGDLELYLAESTTHVMLEPAADGTWYDVAASRGLLPFDTDRFMTWGSALTDADNDGRMELILGTGAFWRDTGQPVPSWWFEEDADGRFVEGAAARGLPDAMHTRAVIARDLNDDGVLDVILSDGWRTPWIYLSEGCTTDAWLEIGGPPGTEGTVEAGGVTRGFRIAGDEGWGASAPAVAHVGLGPQEIVTRIVLRSPVGPSTTLEGPVLARRRITWRP